ncbi:MAG TPA: cupin domain-containing protein [Candidatus Caenarcaniphilales bacterium]
MEISHLTPLLKANDIEALPEVEKVHGLNTSAVRYTNSLSESLQMTPLGIHLVRVQPGKETTQFHFHHQEEEFICIISGRGIADIGEAQFEVGPGAFMGFTAPSLPHCYEKPI